MRKNRAHTGTGTGTRKKVMSVVYKPEYIHSYDALSNYFNANADEAIAQIEAYEPPAVLDYRWQIAWLVITTPLRIMLEIFLTCLEPLLKCLGASHLAIRCHILYAHLATEDYFLYTLLEGRADAIMAPLFNTYAFSASDVYLAPTVKTELIHDQKVFNTFELDKEWNKVDFYRPDGVCRGITTWFTYLFLRTQENFAKNPDGQMQAIGSLFYWGAPAPAALLQALCNGEVFLNVHATQLHRIPLTAQEATRDTIHSALKDAAPGAYEVWFTTHRIGYIKINDQLGYVIEPNGGVFKIEGKEHALNVADYLWSYRSRRNNVLFLFHNTLKSPA